MSKRERQVLGKVERIYSRVWYLGKKREFRKHKRGDWRIWERISARYKRSKSAKKKEKNI